MRTASPSDLEKALMAGFGPMNVASSAPEKMASTASGPALNGFGVSVTLSGNAASKMPCLRPASAVAWVRFGK